MWRFRWSLEKYVMLNAERSIIRGGAAHRVRLLQKHLPRLSLPRAREITRRTGLHHSTSSGSAWSRGFKLSIILVKIHIPCIPTDKPSSRLPHLQICKASPVLPRRAPTPIPNGYTHCPTIGTESARVGQTRMSQPPEIRRFPNSGTLVYPTNTLQPSRCRKVLFRADGHLANKYRNRFREKIIL